MSKWPFHLSILSFFGCVFLWCFEKCLLVIPWNLFFRFKHELLNFLRRSNDIDWRSNLSNLSNDNFESAYPGLIEFAKVINDFDDL